MVVGLVVVVVVSVVFYTEMKPSQFSDTFQNAKQTEKGKERKSVLFKILFFNNIA